MIRVALIGCGAIARHSHIPAWKSIPQARLVALCDQSLDTAQSLQKRFGLDCRLYENLEETLVTEKPDVLDICTPGHLHFEHAFAGLSAGTNVLVEKPPVMSVEEADILLELAESKQRKIGAVFNFRYYDVIQEAKKAIDAGLVGKVTKIHVIHHANNVYAESPYLWDERRSKYLLYDFGIHFIDAMLFLGGPVEEILYVLPTQSEYSGETTDLLVVFRFESGAIGTFEITADFTRHSSHQTRIDICGTAMDMFVRRFPPSVRLAAGIQNPIDILFEEIKADWRIASKILTRQYLRWRNISHERVIGLYVDWLLGNAQYPMSLVDCMPTLRVLRDLEKAIPAYF